MTQYLKKDSICFRLAAEKVEVEMIRYRNNRENQSNFTTHESCVNFHSSSFILKRTCLYNKMQQFIASCDEIFHAYLILL